MIGNKLVHIQECIRDDKTLRYTEIPGGIAPNGDLKEENFSCRDGDVGQNSPEADLYAIPPPHLSAPNPAPLSLLPCSPLRLCPQSDAPTPTSSTAPCSTSLLLVRLKEATVCRRQHRRRSRRLSLPLLHF
ncbi:hypothetical protein AHAS_Ahas13G0175300 [Arachis hypogaea]